MEAILSTIVLVRTSKMEKQKKRNCYSTLKVHISFHHTYTYTYTYTYIHFKKEKRAEVIRLFEV